ncbi:MAG: porin [bacterium]|nr:porin [bacterium]
MKKILLSTSALAGLAFASCVGTPTFAAEAQAPALKISGQAAGAMYFHNAKRNSENGGKRGPGTVARIEDTRINFDVHGSTEALGGLEYSLLIGLSADRGETNTARETRIKFKGQWGTFSFGNTRGPDNFGVSSAAKVMGGLGGFDGNLTDIVNVSSGVLWSTGLTGAGSPMKDAVKAVYLTPRVEGFQLGVGYTPNGQQDGGNVLKTSTNESTGKIFGQNNVTGLLSYKNSFDNGVSLGLSLSGVTGQTKSIRGSTGTLVNKVQKARSWAVGGQLGYAGWELGAQYIDNGKSHANTTHLNNAKGGTAVSVGLGYAFGAHKLAAGYYHSDKKLGELNVAGAALAPLAGGVGADLGKARANIYSLTYDFKVAPGLGLFAEANYFNLKNKDAAAAFQNAYKGLNSSALEGVGSNRGHAFLIGTKVKF